MSSLMTILLCSNAPKVYGNIKPDEIPEVPPNRFLSRSFKNNEKQNENNDRQDKRRDERSDHSRKFSYSKSGRKIKGRGFIVSFFRLSDNHFKGV